jgi:perosamine synthetase
MEIKYPVYQPLLNGNEKKYVNECLDTNWISSKGSFIRRFEEKFAGYVEIEHATTVCNGTAAVELALMTLGIGTGDEVIVPTLVYVAVPNMVMLSGATPVFVDSLPRTWQMDPEDIRRKITSRTKAVIAVHNYGHACEMDVIKSICDSAGIYLIEDCAEALGGKFNNRHVGYWGDISTYSFFGNKTITTGEGGMITSHSEELIKKAFHLKNQGVTTRVYWHDVLANNYRMTNITAAIGLAQLEHIEKVLKRKREIAELYNSYFLESAFEFHQEDKRVLHSYWMCSILTQRPDQREPLRDFLLSKGIETRPFFYPAHTMPMYKDIQQDTYQVAEDISARGINLPSFPALSDEDVRDIASTVLSFPGI